MANKPRQLQEGDTIGIVTLGSPLDAQTINQGINMLKDMGFQVIVGDHAYSVSGFLAGTPEQQSADLMAMFRNPQVKMILPTRGGVGVASILPYLDYPLISKNPKLISGYSDITILLNVLYQYANLVTFHSLMLLDFKPGTPPYNYNQFFNAITRLTAPWPITNPPEMQLVSKVPGNVTGPIVGGNLTSFVGTLGTPYEIDTKGKILFLEDTHEPANTIFRYINHLKLAGKFDDCIGILIGQCSNCEPAYGKTFEDVIDEFIVPLGKPLMTNIASGHGLYKAAIPFGVNVNMNATNRTLTVMEPTVIA
ncbi:S66 peptidase family protein [Fictibacillus phosphorivorans]|uniref:S66 peptidase family protein n=1 Tax=Fictibacillus phosphorivorans TaxID=1221500 RepID=UPI00203FFAD7|nr:LD-carboxypeptidase [Fictibacillus phosphorivorans]MCM3718152.1 LD-carboxypeptidase [Fictibacillus phosphorivorans]MCM3775779.1 LD-carboxypeptidase [Fictibacillus phosphorivorans]